MEYFKSQILECVVVGVDFILVFGVDFNQRINSNQLFCFFVAVIITLRKVLTQDSCDEI